MPEKGKEPTGALCTACGSGLDESPHGFCASCGRLACLGCLRHVNGKMVDYLCAARV